MNRIEMITLNGCAPCATLKPQVEAFAANRGIAFVAKNAAEYPDAFLADNEVVAVPVLLLIENEVLVRVVDPQDVASSITNGGIIDQTFATLPNPADPPVENNNATSNIFIPVLVVLGLIYILR